MFSVIIAPFPAPARKLFETESPKLFQKGASMRNPFPIRFGLVCATIAGLVIGFLGICTASAAAKFPEAAQPACPPAEAGRASCAVMVMRSPRSEPSGLTPAQLHMAYDLPVAAIGATPPIIAILNAYDAPKISKDLDFYSQTFGIPSLPACKGDIGKSTVACFKKVDQQGGHNFPQGDSWHTGASLEVEAAHAICQNCSILLVEADDSLTTNLYIATDYAATQATYVLTPFYFTATENQTVYQSFDQHFNHAGVLIVAPEAMNGYNVFAYPAASKYVTAVGATLLSLKKDGAYESEVVFEGTTSYCDQYENRPRWQKGTGCRKRMGADVAMVGVNFALYDTTDDSPGWLIGYGTSLSAAIIDAVFALANDHQSDMSAIPYERYSLDNFYDITKGSTAKCKPKRFCTAVRGYDGPSGLGTPNGIGGF